MQGPFLLRLLQSRGAATQMHVAANGVTRFGLAQGAIKDVLVYRTRLVADVVTGRLDVRAAAASLPDVKHEPDLDTALAADAGEHAADAESNEALEGTEA